MPRVWPEFCSWRRSPLRSSPLRRLAKRFVERIILAISPGVHNRLKMKACPMASLEMWAAKSADVRPLIEARISGLAQSTDVTAIEP